ncbi:MAG: GNAT family protein [Candidatus Acidiferrales bacterium]
MTESKPMIVEPVILEGRLVRLEPLRKEHLEALAEVALAPEIWRWTPIRVTTEADLRFWMEKNLEMAAAGKGLPWVTWSKASGKIVGSTRYMDIDARNRGLEIGGTWIAPAWQRSGINVEAKYLQLRHAFEVLGAIRVAFKTHHNNLQSQTAIAALGAKPEGVFRNHMIMPDGSFRSSVWFSITQEEWPGVKSGLEARMAAHA